MQRVIPALRITDLDTSRAFYDDGLGFEIVWVHRFGPDMPAFVAIERDGMRVFLTEHAGDCQPGGLVHLYVPDVDAWYREFQGRGVPVLEPPSNDLPGLRCMTVVDPDGNQLRIVTRLDEPRP